MMKHAVVALLASLALAGAQAIGAEAYRTSAILGLPVIGAGGVALGQVKDLMVAPGGQISFVIFADPSIHAGDEAMATPWSTVEIGREAVRVHTAGFMRLEFGGSSIYGWSVAAVTGSSVQVEDRLDWGWVDDALVTPQGQVTHLAVAAVAGGRYLVPLDKAFIDYERDEVTVHASPPQIAGFRREDPPDTP